MRRSTSTRKAGLRRWLDMRNCRSGLQENGTDLQNQRQPLGSQRGSLPAVHEIAIDVEVGAIDGSLFAISKDNELLCGLVNLLVAYIKDCRLELFLPSRADARQRFSITLFEGLQKFSTQGAHLVAHFDGLPDHSAKAVRRNWRVDVAEYAAQIEAGGSCCTTPWMFMQWRILKRRSAIVSQYVNRDSFGGMRKYSVLRSGSFGVLPFVGTFTRTGGRAFSAAMSSFENLSRLPSRSAYVFTSG